MGAVSFSLDSRLVASLRGVMPLNVLVETGTFKGDTVFEFSNKFDSIISIELSHELCVRASKRFEQYSNIAILAGDSVQNLRELRSKLEAASVLYWLDAHWCVASNTAGEKSQCPLLGELGAIESLNGNSVVLIDDARLFLAPPLAPHNISDWPTFDEIVHALYKLSSAHELMVINDVIAFYPKFAVAAMSTYAQSFGVDWLFASNCMKEAGTLIPQLEEKEREIHEKEAAIQDLAKNLRNYSAVFSVPVLGSILRLISQVIIFISPRIGNLNQYKPRSLLERNFVVMDQIEQRSAPSISLVTPSFQQGHFIGRTIDSILGQNYPNLEYVIQDGESADSTVDVIRSYGELLQNWISEEDDGQSQAINRGFARTSGEIMGWVNSDDLLLPNALAIVADFFRSHPLVDVVYGDRLLIDENDQEIGRWMLPRHSDAVLSWADFIPQETMFWRRRIWDRAGGKIDESFRFAMDWDLIVRFRAANAKFAHIPHFLGAFRIHRQQKTSAQMSQIGQIEMNRIRERLLGRVPSQKEIRNAVFIYMLKHIVVDLAYRLKVVMKFGKQ